MQLQRLSASISGAQLEGDGTVDVRGITHDSRNVKPGDLFVCLVGAAFDGHRFAGDAVARGAIALVVQIDRAGSRPRGIPALIVANTRTALPNLAATICGHPSRSMKLVGVTGTNGKTTTTALTASILRSTGLQTGTIGTLGAELMGEALPSEHTTPEADQLQALLAAMRARGAEAAVMEVSSHALALSRTDGCAYDAAAFTNLTQDHLDFHGTIEAYYLAKRRLFTDYPAASDKPFAAVINVDDPYGLRLAKESAGRILTFGIEHPADITAEQIRTDPGHVGFRAITPAGAFDARLRIGGAFQVYNALAAIGLGLALGIQPERIAGGLSALPSVPGRFESVPTDRGFHVIVDYAHSPDGLENLIESARRLNPARLIIVFGCGGNRDRTKRPIMGRLAASRADVAIVTSDNPRHEDPQAIIDEILTGMTKPSAKVQIEPDRRAAIALALGEARAGDVVLVAGKGHETYQIVGDQVLPFDDRQIARELLATPGLSVKR